jgi:hypothetical protein
VVLEEEEEGVDGIEHGGWSVGKRKYVIMVGASYTRITHMHYTSLIWMKDGATVSGVDWSLLSISLRCPSSSWKSAERARYLAGALEISITMAKNVDA